MPQTNTSPIAEAIRAARTSRHTDAVISALDGLSSPPPSDGVALTLLDVARECAIDGVPPTFGALLWRVSGGR